MLSSRLSRGKGRRARLSRQPRLHAPAAEVLRHRDHEVVVARDERQEERVVVADAAEEAIVARAIGVVAAVERAAVEKDDGAVAEAELERAHLRALGERIVARASTVLLPSRMPLTRARSTRPGRLGLERRSRCAPRRASGAALRSPSSAPGKASETCQSRDDARRRARGGGAGARASVSVP